MQNIKISNLNLSIFRGKIFKLGMPRHAQNGPKIGLFELFSKSLSLNFPIFCTKLEGMMVHKIAQAIF